MSGIDSRPHGAAAIRVTSDQTRVDLRQAHQWIASAYWSRNIPWGRFEQACSNSLVFAAFDREDQVGFARVVTDSTTFAWLCDVFVPEHARGRGVARHVMEAITMDERLQGLRQFVLATSDAHGLYERFGFERLGEPGGRFMRIFRSPFELYAGKSTPQ